MSAELPRLRRRFARAFPSQRGDMNGSSRLTHFTPRDCEDTPAVSLTDAPIRLRDIEARALGRPQRLIPQSRILDSRLHHRNQQVAGYAVGDQFLMRK